METIRDDYQEHELHYNQLKTRSAKYCSTCYKELQTILKRINKKQLTSPLTRLEAGMSF